MPLRFDTPVIKAKQLLDSLTQGLRFRFIDASWALSGTDFTPSFRASHLPEAVFWDIEAFSDKSSNLPHMAPPLDQFNRIMSNFGIVRDDAIIVYDQIGFFSAPRVWWTLKLFGHPQVYLLNGGLRAWSAIGGPTTHTISTPPPSSYDAHYDRSLVISANEVEEVLEEKKTLILDARSLDRFYARTQEPRPNLLGGHIPNSVCLPFSDLLDGHVLKSKQDLSLIFEPLDIGRYTDIITTCGSGVTAAIIFAALHHCGLTGNVRLFDGSWAQWGDPNARFNIETH